MLAKPAKLAKAVCDHLCELRGLGVRNTTKQFVITYVIMNKFFERLVEQTCCLRALKQECLCDDLSKNVIHHERGCSRTFPRSL